MHDVCCLGALALLSSGLPLPCARVLPNNTAYNYKVRYDRIMRMLNVCRLK